MQNNQDKRRVPEENSQRPGPIADQPRGEKDSRREAKGNTEKTVGESYMDYNGNSEENAPARSRE